MIPHSPFLNPQWPWSVVRSPVLRSQWSLVTNCAYNATSPFTAYCQLPSAFCLVVPPRFTFHGFRLSALRLSVSPSHVSRFTGSFRIPNLIAQRPPLHYVGNNVPHY